MRKILVIGESCKDVFHYGTCERLCPEAPVPVFKSCNLIENGGMAMNVYNNVVSMNCPVDLNTNNNWNTIRKTRFVDIRTNHMFMRLDENDDNYLSFNRQLVDLNNYDAVIVSDYNKGFLTEDDLHYISVSHPLTFLDTKKLLGAWSENFGFIKINKTEFERTKSTISNKIKNSLIVTQGPDGCVYKGTTYKVPPVEVKDTSGAGDTFISALCVKFCETGNIQESIKFANECATRVVQKKGVATP